MLAGLADPREALSQVVARVFHTPPFLSCAEWADKFAYYVDDKKPVKYRLATDPYARSILNLIHRPGIREIVHMKAERVAGTAKLHCILGYFVDRRPCSTMIVYPNATIAGRMNTERITPAINAAPCLKARLGTASRDQKTHAINFDRMRLYMSAAPPGRKIDANLEAHGYGLVQVDELDRCHPDVVETVEGRGKDRATFLLMLTGTPSYAGQGVDLRYNGGENQRPSDKGRFYVPCPHEDCRQYHVREFRHVRWPGIGRDGKASDETRDVGADPEEVRIRAWFKCPACGKKIGAEHNLWQAERHVLLTAGQTIGAWKRARQGKEEASQRASEPASQGKKKTKTGKSGGTQATTLESGSGSSPNPGSLARWFAGSLPDAFVPGVVTGAESRSPRAGVHQGGLYQCFQNKNPYGEVATGFVASRGRPTEVWVQRTLGEPWQVKGESVQLSDLKGLCAALTSGGYRIGTVPAWVLLLVASVDVQAGGGGYAWVSIYGIGEAGRDRCLIWFGKAQWPEETDGAKVDATVDQVFTRADGRRMRAAIEFVDEGDRTTEVVSRARRRCMAGRISWTAKGVGLGGGAESMAGPHELKWIDRLPDGAPDKRGPRRLRVNSFVWKRACHRMMRPQGAPKNDEDRLLEEALGEGADFTPSGRLFLPADAADDYLRQMVSEQLSAVKARGSSRVTYKFVPRPGFPDNHAFDCFVQFTAGVDAIPEIRGLRAVPAGAVKTAATRTNQESSRSDRRTSPALERARARAAERRG